MTGGDSELVYKYSMNAKREWVDTPTGMSMYSRKAM